VPELNTDRMHFYYRTHGDPAGFPMLLLHGSHASSRWWQRFFEVLPDDIYAVAPDLRGCGESDKAEIGYAIDAQAEDIWSLVESLGWRDFDLVAHSSAAAIAMELLLTHPAIAANLILVSPVPAEGLHTPVEALVLLNEMKDDRDLHRTALASLMPSFDLETSAENRQFFDQILDDARGMAPAAFTETAVALGWWNRFADVQRLTLPTLLIWGDEDMIVGRDAVTRTFIAIPGANNLEVLSGVGHAPMIEAPLRLAERIIDFVAEDTIDYEEIRGQAFDQAD
jgi:pimeloyl-ACP methyl ester carboxylesterase